jgi:hypothetical protein
MKINYRTVIIILIAAVFAGCSGKTSSKKGASGAGSLNVPDTGYTGIQKYFSNDRIVKEVTFRNGVRQGEMKSFYKGGQVYQSFWYENGLREDVGKWYYVDGPVFRTTPYVHDTIHGTQIQYYRNGKVKAKLNYVKGLRTPVVEEYLQDGKLINEYPDITYKIVDNYSSNGKIRIDLELTNKAEKVRFYRGEIVGGVVDTSKYDMIRTDLGKGFLDLKKSDTTQKDYVGVIAEIITGFGNKYFTYKRIDLPYKDLK